MQDHNDHKSDLITWSDFEKVEIRTGTVINAVVFEKAHNPAYILHIDFGSYGIKKSSAQITKLYQPEDIIGKQVIAVINFPPKQIATLKSECLVLGAIGADKEVTLLTTDKPAANGLRIG